ncbi:hypothetical protein LOK49_LG04G01493 [Camellia lanceoleosa]|uniref:Uncharacterized protein n=1 Tax=Camellia lanceoleosa TaxID=1840588 RepID=A0ACC0I2L2_9ERIC|nr:hypothetical protein LOK49_LG04G01493 [Camellia lanceoleosa]
MNSTAIDRSSGGSKQKHSSGKGMQKSKHITGAATLAHSMDDFVNSVKSQSRELTVNHVVGTPQYTIAEAVTQLYEIERINLADPLLHYNVSLIIFLQIGSY